MKHTRKFVTKIIEEFGYTMYEVRRQVHEWSGMNLSTMATITYLRHFSAGEIRAILRFNTL